MSGVGAKQLRTMGWHTHQKAGQGQAESDEAAFGRDTRRVLISQGPRCGRAAGTAGANMTDWNGESRAILGKA